MDEKKSVFLLGTWEAIHEDVLLKGGDDLLRGHPGILLPALGAVGCHLRRWFV